MKHIKTLFFAFAAALTLLASCSKEELSPLRFHATIDNNDAKCAYNGTQVVWNEDEPIKIFSANASTGETWTANVGDDALNAEFEHIGTSALEGASGPFYAVSNVISSGSLSGETLSVNINSAVNASAPITFMASKSTGHDLHFKHFSGLLAFDYNVSLPHNKASLQSIAISTTNKALSGEFTITFDANGVPAAVPQSGSSNTLTYSTSAKSGTVYFPIMPGSYDNLTITFTAYRSNNNKTWTWTCTKTFNNSNNPLVFAAGEKRVIEGTISEGTWHEQ